MWEIITIGLDLAKTVFQLHGADASGRAVLRQTTGFVESLLRLVGLDWTVPDFSTLSRRQKTLAVTIPYRGSQG
ncbi:MAG: transposase, partial [Paracoccaceae bacterium]|nr:transposase [Paracoccaceae bacterium]